MALLTHNRRIGSLCRRHCYDLSIAEMLSDTIVQALMEADGIEPEILAAQLRGIAQQISAARREDKNALQLVKRVILRWMIALMLPHFPVYALDMDRLPQAISAHTEVAPTPQTTMLAALPPTTSSMPKNEPWHFVDYSGHKR